MKAVFCDFDNYNHSNNDLCGGVTYTANGSSNAILEIDNLPGAAQRTLITDLTSIRMK